MVKLAKIESKFVNYDRLVGLKFSLKCIFTELQQASNSCDVVGIYLGRERFSEGIFFFSSFLLSQLEIRLCIEKWAKKVGASPAVRRGKVKMHSST